MLKWPVWHLTKPFVCVWLRSHINMPKCQTFCARKAFRNRNVSAHKWFDWYFMFALFHVRIKLHEIFCFLFIVIFTECVFDGSIHGHDEWIWPIRAWTLEFGDDVPRNLQFSNPTRNRVSCVVRPTHQYVPNDATKRYLCNKNVYINPSPKLRSWRKLN